MFSILDSVIIPSTLGLRPDLVYLTLNYLRRSYIDKNISVLDKTIPVLIKFPKMHFEKIPQSWGLTIRRYFPNETSDDKMEVINVISEKK